MVQRNQSSSCFHFIALTRQAESRSLLVALHCVCSRFSESPRSLFWASITEKYVKRVMLLYWSFNGLLYTGVREVLRTFRICSSTWINTLVWSPLSVKCVESATAGRKIGIPMSNPIRLLSRTGEDLLLDPHLYCPLQMEIIVTCILTDVWKNALHHSYLVYSWLYRKNHSICVLNSHIHKLLFLLKKSSHQEMSHKNPFLIGQRENCTVLFLWLLTFSSWRLKNADLKLCPLTVFLALRSLWNRHRELSLISLCKCTQGYTSLGRVDLRSIK